MNNIVVISEETLRRIISEEINQAVKPADMLVNQIEASIVLGCTPLTVAGYEKRGLLANHAKEGDQCRYLISEVIKLKRDGKKRRF